MTNDELLELLIAALAPGRAEPSTTSIAALREAVGDRRRETAMGRGPSTRRRRLAGGTIVFALLVLAASPLAAHGALLPRPLRDAIHDLTYAAPLVAWPPNESRASVPTDGGRNDLQGPSHNPSALAALLASDLGWESDGPAVRSPGSGDPLAGGPGPEPGAISSPGPGDGSTPPGDPPPDYGAPPPDGAPVPPDQQPAPTDSPTSPTLLPTA